jgi:hypothetical protein
MKNQIHIQCKAVWTLEHYLTSNTYNISRFGSPEKFCGIVPSSLLCDKSLPYNYKLGQCLTEIEKHYHNNKYIHRSDV